MKEVYPLYLDERAYTVLKTIVNNPSITGKEVEMSFTAIQEAVKLHDREDQ